MIGRIPPDPIGCWNSRPNRLSGLPTHTDTSKNFLLFPRPFCYKSGVRNLVSNEALPNPTNRITPNS